MKKVCVSFLVPSTFLNHCDYEDKSLSSVVTLTTVVINQNCRYKSINVKFIYLPP